MSSSGRRHFVTSTSRRLLAVRADRAARRVEELDQKSYNIHPQV